MDIILHGNPRGLAAPCFVVKPYCTHITRFVNVVVARVVAGGRLPVAGNCRCYIWTSPCRQELLKPGMVAEWQFVFFQ
jgi:hypothetical protein